MRYINAISHYPPFPLVDALIWRAGFPSGIGYYVIDQFAGKIDRLGDSIHNKFKLFGLPVSYVPFPEAPFAAVRRGHKEVMPL
jgi:hypothetical protein